MEPVARRRTLAYKFLPAVFALQDLIRREIKISTFPDMNDPFELLGGLPIAPDIEHRFQVLIGWLSGWCGVLCLSRDWQNAMLWSHYADKHSGMCLGLRVGPNVQISKPRYVSNRKKFDSDMRMLLNAATVMGVEYPLVALAICVLQNSAGIHKDRDFAFPARSQNSSAVLVGREES
jgi:hypothetical protein